MNLRLLLEEFENDRLVRHPGFLRKVRVYRGQTSWPGTTARRPESACQRPAVSGRLAAIVFGGTPALWALLVGCLRILPAGLRIDPVEGHVGGSGDERKLTPPEAGRV